MTPKRIAGFALIASPFVAIATLIVIHKGWLEMVLGFGGIAIVVGVLALGVKWAWPQ